MSPEEIKARGHPIYMLWLICAPLTLVFLIATYGNVMVLNPSFHIDDFYVPALNKNLLNSSDTTPGVIFFNLKIHNNMLHAAFSYHAANVSISYNSTVLGTYAIPGFYQGMSRTARRRDVVMLTSSLPADLSTAEFRVDVAVAAKLKNWFWYFKEKRITAGGTVAVDDTGKKASSESVELKSGKPSAVKIVFWILGYIFLVVFSLAMTALGVLWCGSICYDN